MFLGIITLLSALSISAIAAYFSIVGLAELFAATFWSVVVMAGSLEIGKLVAASWLHSNWNNPRLRLPHKLYLVSSIIILMFITSLGIFGYLSKGHLDQNIPSDQIKIELSRLDEKINQSNSNIKLEEQRLQQLDDQINSLIAQKHVVLSDKMRTTQIKERNEIKDNITRNNKDIDTYQTHKSELKGKLNTVEAKLGPIKYIADLLEEEGTSTDKAIRIIILLLIFSFDPLAVLLLLAANVSFHDYAERRRILKQNTTTMNNSIPSNKIDDIISPTTLMHSNDIASVNFNILTEGPHLNDDIKDEPIKNDILPDIVPVMPVNSNIGYIATYIKDSDMVTIHSGLLEMGYHKETKNGIALYYGQTSGNPHSVIIPNFRKGWRYDRNSIEMIAKFFNIEIERITTTLQTLHTKEGW